MNISKKTEKLIDWLYESITRLIFDLAFFRQVYYIEFEIWNFMERYKNLGLKMRSFTSGTKEQLDINLYEYVNKENTEHIDLLGLYVCMKHIYF